VIVKSQSFEVKAYRTKLPTLVGQLRDVSGTFLLPIVVLAVTGEGMFLSGLMLPKTGRKAKANVRQD
jgi:hypothetical protein